MAVTPLPDVVAHADWSVSAAKRWVAVAAPSTTGATSWRPSSPSVSAGERLARSGGAEPIVWPTATVRCCSGSICHSGCQWPTAAGPGSPTWRSGCRVDADLGRSGRRQHHRRRSRRLGRCTRPVPAAPAATTSSKRPWGRDRSTSCAAPASANRRSTRAACPVFWTLGANQVGRGAVLAWREVVREGGCRLWPFDGDLPSLVRGGRRDGGGGLPDRLRGVARRRRSAGGRASVDRPIAWRGRRALSDAATSLDVDVTGEVRRRRRGRLRFREPAGEDAFDAFVGGLGHDPRPPRSPPCRATAGAGRRSLRSRAGCSASDDDAQRAGVG